MSKYRFSWQERFAVWDVLGPKCRWCLEPVEYRDMNVDHIIPEDLLNVGNESLRESLLKTYNLNDGFNINSFSNWIPTHPHCNQSKSNRVFEGVPIIMQLLKEVQAKVPRTIAVYNKLTRSKASGKLMASIENAVSEGAISIQDVNSIFARQKENDDPVIGITANAISMGAVYAPASSFWTIIGRNDQFYTMKKDNKIAFAPVSDTPDPIWLCERCRHYGPWDGDKCQECGTTTDHPPVP